MRHQQGMTLIEIIVTLSIAMVLISIAVPAFNNQIEKSAQRAVTLDFIVGMSYARAESVKRGENVHLHSLSGTDNWDTGWCVTQDSDCSGELIRRFDIPSRISINSGASGISTFTFNAEGNLSSTTTSVSFCSDDEGKKITVTPLGQALMKDCTCDSSAQCG